MDDILNGFANVGTLQDDLDIKELQNRNANEVTMGIGLPRQIEGKTGDITVRKIPGAGLIAYIKTTFGGWVDINSMTVARKTEWINMNLSNSRAEVGAATRPSYFRDAAGFVHFKGSIKSGSSFTAAFTVLPPSYRPSRSTRIVGGVAVAKKNPCIVLITSGGVCSFENWSDASNGGTTSTTDGHSHTVATASYTSNTASTGTYLDGISFYANQPAPAGGGGGGVVEGGTTTDIGGGTA